MINFNRTCVVTVSFYMEKFDGTSIYLVKTKKVPLQDFFSTSNKSALCMTNA
jgi:hypothetical protein